MKENNKMKAMAGTIHYGLFYNLIFMQLFFIFLMYKLFR